MRGLNDQRQGKIDRSPMDWQTASTANYLSHQQVMTAVFLVAAGLVAYLVSGYVI
jgi:hypothetical protein